MSFSQNSAPAPAPAQNPSQVVAIDHHAPAKPPLWEALVEDSDAAVARVDEIGRIRFANDRFRSVFGIIQEQPGELQALLPRQVAEEQIGLLRASCARESVVRVDTVLRGNALRIAYHPLPKNGTPERTALFVARRQANAAKASEDVVAGRARDLGQLAGLTPRELDVLRLIALGLSTADVAARLFRSVKTIEGHRVSLGAKLGVSNRVELARIAIRAGLVGVDEQPPPMPDAAKPS
ncbi:MAG: LuxR C-terminal-related transcriptional regulator [Planctomycetota bacterium]